MQIILSPGLTLGMNYLAHAYLSFNHPQVLAGNMISDFVKGKKQYDYPPLIRKGIQLHREIDHFTDSHPVTKEMKQVFRPVYGLYAGAFTDIAYDYYLANDHSQFSSPEALQLFAADTYAALDNEVAALPLVFQQVFVYMKQYDWLSNYRFEWGIQKSFNGMAHRAKYIREADTAFQIFRDHIVLMKTYYDEFFPLLKNHAAHTMKQLLNTD